VAKKEAQFNGVFDLAGNNQIDQVLGKIEVNDVWGIGRRSTEKLNNRCIYTALDLKRADETWIRKHLTVVGARTLMELNEISCISLENAPASPKSIITSRSFGHPVTDFDNLREAVISYVSIAGEKLRKQGVEAETLNLFVTTGPFDENASYSNNQTITLHRPTSSTPELITAALQCLKSLYKPGYRYRKAGVMLAGIVKQGYRQQDLFSFAQQAVKKEDKQLMTALDRINSKWGRSTLQYGMTTAEDKPWAMQQTWKSPAYTTNWQELPVVKAASSNILERFLP
ncbi:MAG: DUF4113 domain-containing protein, partial [Desulfocapsaceae bacterium]|nr:DUF4113 domain-containing protein [Desulfocapsaceae bacterium]